MIQVNTLAEALFGLVGFRQDANDYLTDLPSDLLASRSGLMVQDAHPLLTNENIFLTAPDFKRQSSTELTANTRYAEWLRQRMKASCLTVAQKMLSHKAFQIKDVLINSRAYHKPGEFANKVIKANRFVGVKVAINQPFEGVMLNINQIGLQLSGTNLNMKAYVFSPNQFTPLVEATFNHESSYFFQWHTLPDQISPQINQPAHELYVGYFESDLSGQAIKSDIDLNNPACNACPSDSYSRGLVSKWKPWINMQAFEVSDLNGTNLPQMDKAKWVTNNNFGINLSVQVVCDYTNIIKLQEKSLAEAVQKQIAADLISAMGNSTRENGIEEKTKQLAMYALDNREHGQIGLLSELEKLYEKLSFEFSGRGPCMPCEKRGYSVSSVFSWA